MFAVPLAFTAGLLALTLLPRLQAAMALLWSFWGAGAILLVWLGASFARLPRALKTARRRIYLAPPRPQHYIQACCHLTVYAFWGYFWRPVYDFAPLLVGQLLFAYAFDMLLSWSRRETYGLGFGPFPIIFSTNLFLWFIDDWFAFQFLLVARRLCRQGVRPLGTRRQASAHLQPVGVHAGHLLRGAAGHGHDRT